MNYWCNIDVVENQGQHLRAETKNRRPLLLLNIYIHIHAGRRRHLLFSFNLCIHAIAVIILLPLLLLLLLLLSIVLLSSPEEPQASSFGCAERERRLSRVEFSLLHHRCSCLSWDSCGWHGQGDSFLAVDLGHSCSCGGPCAM